MLSTYAVSMKITIRRYSKSSKLGMKSLIDLNVPNTPKSEQDPQAKQRYSRKLVFEESEKNIQTAPNLNGHIRTELPTGLREKDPDEGRLARTPRVKEYHKKAKLPSNVKVYEGSKDPEDHLGSFLAVAEQEEWLMLVWCMMFCQTLSGAVRNWFDYLDPKSTDSIKELSQKFIKEFLKQKRYAKDPMEIHGIKRRMNEGIHAMAMGHLELAKWGFKNDKYKTVGRYVQRESPILGGPEVEKEPKEEAANGQFQRHMGTCGILSEIMYEHCFKSFDADVKSRLRIPIAPLIGFSGDTSILLG
ncbi:hypothetical protein Tco_0542579 [Tanacetum coccineum]